MKIANFVGTLKVEDGVTRVVLTLIREAQKKGIESIIITGWAEDASMSPVPVIQVPSVIVPVYKEYRLSTLGIREFSKKLDEFRPDIIHVHSPDTIAWAALRYARKRKIPIVATHHTGFDKYLAYYHADFLKASVWFLMKQTYSQMVFVTTPSSVVTKEFLDHDIANAVTIPWGVDLDRFSDSFRSVIWRKQILKKKRKFILLCVCRITWEKDLRTLAEVYKLLNNKRKDFVMVIAGDGPAREKLESLMPGAIFLGHIGGATLSKVYASSDIFVFPSTTETFGNVTIEAMASGSVPVVANAGGSKSLVINGKNGFLTKPKDSKDICDKVNALLDNSQLRKRMRNASLVFAKRFGWEKVFSKLLKMYKKSLR